jgi:UDP-N-acetylglucosamine 2-epimerase (non-hydrolysing)
MKVLVLFGTRPEVIKLAPVVRALQEHKDAFQVVCVASGQHRDLLVKDRDFFSLRFDRDLQAMHPDQSSSSLLARVLEALDPVLEREAPEIVLIQGDTTTALAGAIAAFHRGIPVGHVEAGLRSGDPLSPFPEEMNRRLITGVATLHFAPTAGNRRRFWARESRPTGSS